MPGLALARASSASHFMRYSPAHADTEAYARLGGETRRYSDSNDPGVS
jgi:hypothetical protein